MSKATKHPQVYEFLQHNHVGVLSTVNKQGRPWGSAVYFVVDEDFNIYFVTRVKTHKYLNLEVQPHASLTVVDGSNQTTVQLAGNISKVPAHDYMNIVFTKLAGLRPHNNPNWAPPIEKIHKGDYIALRLTPSTLQYADYSKAYTDYDQKFIEEII